jgi:hypothetical protein
MGSKSRRRLEAVGRGGPSRGKGAEAAESEVVLGPRSGSLARAEPDVPTLEEGAGWPSWARVVASILLMVHFLAVVAGALGVPPSSELERRIADRFTFYHDFFDQGYAYRYYAEPPPTPVILATLRFGQGEPDRVVRIPDRSLKGPRMRHQRQLALANALFADFQEVKRHFGDGSRSRLAGSYARHLCRSHPGCREVTLHAQQHLIPAPEQVRERRGAVGAGRFDLFDESLFTLPEWIGDFPCGGS